MANLPILKTDAANIPRRVLVVGDPGRLQVVSGFLEHVQPISENREYHSLKGQYRGETVGVVSHGVGSAGAGVCFEELCQAGVRRIVRLGSAGGMQDDVGAGDIVIATGAVRCDGLSPKLVPEGYPAVPTADVLIAMRAAAQAASVEAREGLVLTSDLFYPHDVLGSDLPRWQRAGVLAVEMEMATLFVICALHGVETGAVVAVDGNPLKQDEGSMETYDPHQENVTLAVERCTTIALQALVS